MSVCAAPTCSHQSFDGSSYYVDVDVECIIKVANFHGYHLEHLCGLRKSSSERQKVANNYGS